MESIISREAKLSSNASDDEWKERLHTVCYKHFSHYDEDFQHIQLYWGCLTRLFTHWLQTKSLPIPDWTTTNPRLPAWATIFFETTDSRLIHHVERREMGGADHTVASLMDNLYNATFATWFEEAATTSLPSPSSANPETSCPHDLELDFLNHIVHAAPTTSTTILYEDDAMTPTEVLFDGMSHTARTLLHHHKLAEDPRISPPLTITIDPAGLHHLTLPWKIFHALLALHCDLDDFARWDLAPWLPGALHFHARMRISYRAEPYDEEGGAETASVVNPTEVVEVEIGSRPGEEEEGRAVELREFFDAHIRPYLEEREVVVERPRDRGVWEGRAPWEIDEEGNVTRPRMLGLLAVVEHLVMEERAGEVQ